MASPNQYTFQRASTMATRALVSGVQPTQTPSASSHDADTVSKPTLQRNTTNHYEQAAAAATKAGHLPATSPTSVVASVNDRIGVPRQQSWNMSDFKGQQQGQLLNNYAVTSGHGYSSKNSSD